MPRLTLSCPAGLRRRAIRTARLAWLTLERTPLAPLLRAEVVRRAKARITVMPAEQVLALLDALAAAGAGAWVAGGWGVDALTGRQSRAHYDLDLLIDAASGDHVTVADALARHGYRKGESEHNPGLPMPWRHVWRHDEGFSVEVLPVMVREPPFNWPSRSAFAVGSIGGRRVPCLSATLQLTLHTGYPPRDVDATDTGLLRAYLDRVSGT